MCIHVHLGPQESFQFSLREAKGWFTVFSLVSSRCVAKVGIVFAVLECASLGRSQILRVCTFSEMRFGSSFEAR